MPVEGASAEPSSTAEVLALPTEKKGGHIYTLRGPPGVVEPTSSGTPREPWLTFQGHWSSPLERWPSHHRPVEAATLSWFFFLTFDCTAL